MNITCDNCMARLNIPDDKLPREKPSVFKCPKCREKVTVNPSEKGPLPEPDVVAPVPPVRRESENRKALVCVNDKELAESFRHTLARDEHLTRVAENTASALKLMEYKMFELLIVDESFDGGRGAGKLLHHVNGLDMSVRRRICVILLSRKLDTANSMAAMHMSVNYIINHNDIENFENILFTALQEHRDMYSVFREAMDRTGKI